jgi:hypothetical protein
MAKLTQYYVTEVEVAKLFAQSGLPADFQRLFARDYVALKADAGTIGDLIEALTVRADQNDIDIAAINVQLVIDDGRLDGHDSDIAAINVNLSALTTAFNAHAADNSAHNVTGNIIGTGDYATLVLGGSVKLAAAVVDQAVSTVVVTNTPNAAGLAYLQADAATWVTLLNELKSDLNTLVTDHNQLTAKVNTMLATERTALQRVT